MADFENVRAVRGPKLSDLTEHVRDALALNLAIEDEYQVGKLAMASYEFVPHALTGLAAAMQTPAAGFRPSTHVTLPLSDDQGGTAAAEQDVLLYGPGDVLGVDPGQIVRRYPPPGSTNSEETFHAHIEFDRPELPWAFSASTPGDRMPPWLTLVVLERDEIEWEPAQAGLQPIMVVPAALLPPLGEHWAWAHAQAPASAAGGNASLSARLSTAYAPVNVSRLLAARVLTQNTNYVACLVPTTDAGRKAGLGLGAGTLAPAWTPQDGTVRLPVYDRWEFRTAPDGDFARLARRLKGIAAPWAIGRRLMDASRPGEPLDELADDESGRRQVIRCALFSPSPRPPDQPPDDSAWTAARTAELKQVLELPALIEGTAGTAPGQIPDLPIVGPRIYAKGQRGTGTIPAGDWFAELNLAPVHRVVAGIGTRVVVKDQEPLMQAAWAQVGEVEKANRELALAELARQLATSVHERLRKVEVGRFLQLTRPLAVRVRLDGAGLTLAGQTVRSATPTTALGGAFRRALRPMGPISRRLAEPERASLVGIVAVAGAPRDFTRPYVELDGIKGLSPTAIASLDPVAVSKAINVDPAGALAAVGTAAQTLQSGPRLATAVTDPALWQAPDTAFQPGAALSERVVGRITELLPANPDRDVVAARWVGGLAAGLAVSGVPGTERLQPEALRVEERVSVVAGRVAPAPVTPRPATPVTPAPVTPSPTTPVVVRPTNVFVTPTVPVRPVLRATGPAMLRAGAGRTPIEAVVLSPVAAGTLSGTITRPTGREAAATATLTERTRLEQFTTPQATALATWLQRASQVTVSQLRVEVASLIAAGGALALRPTPVRDPLAVRREDLLFRLQPTRTVIDNVRARLNLGALAFDVFAENLIRPIMAAPRFDRPMYRALDAYDREWLVPGLGTLPEPELVTLLSTNDVFTEAFLVGLSDEMGRELLWREYPTDARGTYFYRFWNGTQDELIRPIHRFQKTALGSHVTMGPTQQSGRAVVVIRGEVVRRYPDLSVMALRQQGLDEEGRPLLPEAPTGLPDAAPPLFHAMLPPDVMLVGLDITVEALRTPGWWIVLSEHPQATRFRRTESDTAPGQVKFATPGGGEAGLNGATVAKARLENPTRIAFEAGDFLPSS